MDSKKFHAKKVNTFQMRAIGRTVWAGLYLKEYHKCTHNCTSQRGADNTTGIENILPLLSTQVCLPNAGKKLHNIGKWQQDFLLP